MEDKHTDLGSSLIIGAKWLFYFMSVKEWHSLRPWHGNCKYTRMNLALVSLVGSSISNDKLHGDLPKLLG